MVPRVPNSRVPVQRKEFGGKPHILCLTALSLPSLCVFISTSLLFAQPCMSPAFGWGAASTAPRRYQHCANELAEGARVDSHLRGSSLYIRQAGITFLPPFFVLGLHRETGRTLEIVCWPIPSSESLRHCNQQGMCYLGYPKSVEWRGIFLTLLQSSFHPTGKGI